MPKPEESVRPRASWPVRLALRLLLPEDERRAVLSELVEAWEARRLRDGERAADRWYARQLRAYPWRLSAERLRRAFVAFGSRRAGLAVNAAAGRRGGSGAAGDVRHALRGWRRSPVLASTIVLTVALGLGATTAMYAVVRVVLLDPLPYEGADRLVRIYHAIHSQRWPLSVVDYEAMEAQQTQFDGVAAFSSGERTLTSGDAVERVPVRAVTWNWFELLGTRAAEGRTFEARDGEPGSSRTALVSWGFWQRYLDPALSPVGRSIRLDGEEHTVIGVLPRQVGPLEERFAVFPVLQFEPPTRRGPFTLQVVGRLRIGADTAAAAAELRGINDRIRPLWGSWTDTASTWGVMPLSEFVVGRVRAMLLALLGAVALVLVVASVNAAGLLTARVQQRRTELATRAALGASGLRLVRLLVTESVLLAVAGAALGVALAATALHALRTAGAELLPRVESVVLDHRVLALAAALMGFSLLLFGVIPALQAAGSRSALAQTLRSGGRAVTRSGSADRVRRALVASQFCVAVPLLAGAALLLNSFLHLQRVDPGFDGENVLTARITRLPTNDVGTEMAFWRQLLDRVGELPGAVAAGLNSGRPPRETGNINNFDPLDRPTPAGQAEPTAVWLIASAGYFEALHIPLLEGRLFDRRDGPDLGTTSAIVDRAWADNVYPGESPVGKQMYEGGCKSPDCSIVNVVGVVDNVRYLGLDDAQNDAAVGTVYVPQFQWFESAPYLYVRARGDALQHVDAIRDIVRRLDATAVVDQIAAGADLADRALAAPRNLAVVVFAFALVALVLAMIGVYGVMSYFVHEHRRDIGIRLALGGRPADVLGHVLRGGVRPVMVGTAIGIVLALGATRFLERLLFRVTPHDPAVLAVVTIAMLATAVAGCWLPARHASRLDPGRVLRSD